MSLMDRMRVPDVPLKVFSILNFRFHIVFKFKVLRRWFLNKKSVEALTNTLQVARIPADTFVILDLFGNTSTKFRQADDTLALATRVGGGEGLHELGGRGSQLSAMLGS